MATVADLQSILLNKRREIELGTIDLTDAETAVVEALQNVFPQHVRVILMAVVCLYSHHLGSSAHTLEADCSNFMLSEDWENLETALLVDIADLSFQHSSLGGCSLGEGSAVSMDTEETYMPETRKETGNALPGTCTVTRNALPGTCTETGNALPGTRTETGNALPGTRTETGNALPGTCTETGNALPGTRTETVNALPGTCTETGNALPGTRTETGNALPGTHTETGIALPGTHTEKEKALLETARGCEGNRTNSGTEPGERRMASVGSMQADCVAHTEDIGGQPGFVCEPGSSMDGVKGDGFGDAGTREKIAKQHRSIHDHQLGKEHVSVDHDEQFGGKASGKMAKEHVGVDDGGDCGPGVPSGGCTFAPPSGLILRPTVYDVSSDNSSSFDSLPDIGFKPTPVQVKNEHSEAVPQSPRTQLKKGKIRSQFSESGNKTNESEEVKPLNPKQLSTGPDKTEGGQCKGVRKSRVPALSQSLDTVSGTYDTSDEEMSVEDKKKYTGRKVFSDTSDEDMSDKDKKNYTGRKIFDSDSSDEDMIDTNKKKYTGRKIFDSDSSDEDMSVEDKKKHGSRTLLNIDESRAAAKDEELPTISPPKRKRLTLADKHQPAPSTGPALLSRRGSSAHTTPSTQHKHSSVTYLSSTLSSATAGRVSRALVPQSTQPSVCSPAADVSTLSQSKAASASNDSVYTYGSKAASAISESNATASVKTCGGKKKSVLKTSSLTAGTGGTDHVSSAASLSAASDAEAGSQHASGEAGGMTDAARKMPTTPSATGTGGDQPATKPWAAAVAEDAYAPGCDFKKRIEALDSCVNELLSSAQFLIDDYHNEKAHRKLLSSDKASGINDSVTSIPSTSSCTGNSVPSTSNSTGNCMPSTSNSTGNCMPSASNSTGNCMPSTSNSTGNCMPSTGNSTVNCMPSTRNSTVNCMPSTSNSAGNCMPSTSNSTGNCVPSTSSSLGPVTSIPSTGEGPEKSVASIKPTCVTVPKADRPSVFENPSRSVPSASRIADIHKLRHRLQLTEAESREDLEMIQKSMPSTSKNSGKCVPSTRKAPETVSSTTNGKKTSGGSLKATSIAVSKAERPIQKPRRSVSFVTENTKTAMPSTSRVATQVSDYMRGFQHRFQLTESESRKDLETILKDTLKRSHALIDSDDSDADSVSDCEFQHRFQLTESESRKDLETILKETLKRSHALIDSDDSDADSVSDRDKELISSMFDSDVNHAQSNHAHPDHGASASVSVEDRRDGGVFLPLQLRQAGATQHHSTVVDPPHPQQPASVLLGTKPLLCPAKLSTTSPRKVVLQPAKLGVVRPLQAPTEQQQTRPPLGNPLLRLEDLEHPQIRPSQEHPQNRPPIGNPPHRPSLEDFLHRPPLRLEDLEHPPLRPPQWNPPLRFEHLEYRSHRPEDQPGPSGLQRAAFNPRQGGADAPIDLDLDFELDDSLEAEILLDTPPMVNDAPVRAEPHPGLAFGIQTVMEVFPTADEEIVRGMLEEYLALGHHTLDQALHLTMDHMLQEPPPPVAPPANAGHITVVHVESSQQEKDYFKEFNEPAPYHFDLVFNRLIMDFRNIRVDTIRNVLNRYKGHYAPTFLCFKQALDDLSRHEDSQQKAASKSRRPINSVLTLTIAGDQRKVTAPLMKSMRGFSQSKFDIKHPDLLAEIEFVNKRLRQDKEDKDHQMAWSLLETEYEEAGQAIECGCCFVEHPFENLVQCFEGHLFCCGCLLNYAREAIYGAGKLNLQCMTSDCCTKFPKSQLEKALPSEVMMKYEERLTEEDLNKAAMEDLVRCPSCSMAVVVDPGVQHFKCPNASCRKEMCRKCKEDWSEHRGKTCEQVEKKDETKLRTSYEEKMTEMCVRRCPACRAQFTKESGCNKMTCRCGETMCYICRKPHINYEHFCRHPRDPGKECTSCKKCSLWTNPEEDEKRAVAEIQKEAQVKRREQGYLDDRPIGAPDEPVTKKRKP